MSVVYFLDCPESGMAKVGWANNVTKRISEHQCGCPFELKLIGTIPGDHRLERRIHIALTRCTRRGEWFLSGPTIQFYHDCCAVGVEAAIQTRMDEIAEGRRVIQQQVSDAMAELERIAPQSNLKRLKSADLVVLFASEGLEFTNRILRHIGQKAEPIPDDEPVAKLELVRAQLLELAGKCAA